ncbi:MAG: F0F1 ATP synthase subunit B [Firmicutes bacterium]|nr:F0F1 ATP synthase subunit B [Bacillota bacterium]
MNQFVLLSESYMIDFGLIGPQLIFHMVMVLVLFFIMGKLLFKPVQKILQKRTETIEGQIAQAQTDQNAAKALREEYEAKLQNIQAERDQILSDAYKTAKQRETVILEEARVEVQLMKDRAEKEIEREKAQAKDELRKEAVEIAVVLAQKFVASSIKVKDHDALVEEALAGMEGADWTV